MKHLIFIFIFIVVINLHSHNIQDFINLKQCDQIIDKQVYKICYSYKYKGALAVWYELKGDLVDKKNIKKRPRFYTEKNIPAKFRSKSKDYVKSGFDRGHLANNASFDYDKKIQ
jgi:endonuclease G